MTNPDPAAHSHPLVQVAFGLGSNLGAREETLRRAVRSLAARLTTPVVGGLYSSSSEDGSDQPDYLNTALVGCSRESPEDLLAVAKALERRAGRRSSRRNAARPLDIDLLLWGDLLRDHDELTLPHPRLPLRAFVLAPLADAAPDRTVPPGQRTVAQLLTEVDRGDLRQLPWSTDPRSR